MSTSGTAVSGEGAKGSDVLETNARGDAQLEDAKRQDWQEALEQLESRMKKEFLQQHNPRTRLQDTKTGMETTVKSLEKKVSDLEAQLREGRRRDGREKAAAPLEGRVATLEATVKRLQETVVACMVQTKGCSPRKRSSTRASQPKPSAASATDTSSPTFIPGVKSAPEFTPRPGENIPRFHATTPWPFDLPTEPKELGEELILAVNFGHHPRVRELVAAGANINYFTPEGLTPLMHAAFLKEEIVLSLLLQLGADVNLTASNGMSALHVAAQVDTSARCVKKLLDAGARVDCAEENGWTPLHLAASKDNAAAVRELLAAGASKARRNRHGKTPFDFASNELLLKMLRL